MLTCPSSNTFWNVPASWSAWQCVTITPAMRDGLDKSRGKRISGRPVTKTSGDENARRQRRIWHEHDARTGGTKEQVQRGVLSNVSHRPSSCCSDDHGNKMLSYIAQGKRRERPRPANGYHFPERTKKKFPGCKTGVCADAPTSNQSFSPIQFTYYSKVLPARQSLTGHHPSGQYRPKASQASRPRRRNLSSKDLHTWRNPKLHSLRG